MESTQRNIEEQNNISVQQGVVYSNLGVNLENSQSVASIGSGFGQLQEEVRQSTRSTINLLAVESDEELHRGDTSSLLEHNQQYTALLNAYVENFKSNSASKIKNKQCVFTISMILLVGIPLFSLLLISVTLVCLACGCITALESLPELLAALASLLGTFMAIPKIITKYLFNKDEEKHLADIINKIQDYDRDIRGRL